MPNTLEGDLLARDAKLAIVVSRFNELYTDRLLDSAIHAFKRHGGDPDTLTVANVPGSFELPVTAKKLAQSGKYDAVIALGCIIRGATDHYDHVAGQSSSGIASAALATGVPIVFGVITVDSLEQAAERAGSKQGNQGEKSVATAIEMVNLFKQIEASK